MNSEQGDLSKGEWGVDLLPLPACGLQAEGAA